MSSRTLTVQIRKAEYFPEEDAVKWNTILPDGSAFTFSWPLDKYGYAIGATKNGVRIPRKLLEEHLEEMTHLQKQFNWQINNVSLSDADHSQIDRAMKQLMERNSPPVETPEEFYDRVANDDDDDGCN